MNGTLSEGHDELRDVVRSFLERKSSEAEVRRLMETDTGYDPAVWRQMGDQLGLLGLTVPEEYGGSGYSFGELGLVLEEMGRALLCAPYFSTVVLAVNALLASGDEVAKKDFLPGIASGEIVAALAFTEETGRWDIDGVQLKAQGAGRMWTLSGTKSYVLDGHTADLLLVAARTPAGVSLFAVPRSASGVTSTALSTMDQTRKLARVNFANTPARLIGDAGQGWAIVSRVKQLAAIGLAAEQVGGAQKVLTDAVRYSKERLQFGRPIGSFQAIKHKLADLLAEVESARSAVYHAIALAADPDADLTVMAALVKSHCSEVFLRAATDNVQIHGGVGFTWEHSAHLYLKRAKSSALLLGDPEFHRSLLADAMGF